jgi:hypothetical protein
MRVPTVALPTERWRPPSLYVDLVPQTAWASNLRSVLSEEEWGVCKRLAYARAGHRCEVCGGRGPKWPVEAHERWDYDDAGGVQTLVDLVALCPDCHEASHMGLASVNGRMEAALAHMARVNGWTAAQAREHARAAFAAWSARSDRRWLLDARWVLRHGIPIAAATAARIEAMAAGAAPRG